jgi:hypothetical protein
LTRTEIEHIEIISSLKNGFPQEGSMVDLVQDVVALVAVSSFIVAAATWIGAL